MKYTQNYWDNIHKLKNILHEYSTILIGAGAGLSTAAGMTYDGTRFLNNFADFAKKYHLTDMYSAGFYPFASLEEYWAYWSRHILLNRYTPPSKDTYTQLLNLIKEKEYFVLTTNVDHCFQNTGFNKKNLFYLQGDYGLWQCSKPCTQETYDNKKQVREMVHEQQNMKIPTSLIPYCPRCGAPLTMNLRIDSTFVQDSGWHNALKRYERFIQKHEHDKILYLELGVGNNTPAIIKYPFWNYTFTNPN
ncbi:MAG: Sir2 silent information regulator family NAD-dependent deacetylase, partial [Bifidobacteriaceae bacterium]|nr:Sir2 silent information regulator family NAD-dependent deacetylase [Bifidobacteriaceae bacterium]